MILRIEKLQDACNKILPAVDTSGELISETLQLEADNSRILTISVTNKEYFVKVGIELDEECSFFATVKANLFLKLISQTTSETVELNVDDNNLEVVGNGKYRLPLIDNDGEILRLQEIKINNVTNEFAIDSSILNSMLTYNSKNVAKEGTGRPAQMMYYVDNNGCITYTKGACVNNFKLPQPVKMLLPVKLVKLFKLFKAGDVNFKIGYDQLSDRVTQTKVAFETEGVSITSIISCDDGLLSTVPADAIRGRASKIYPYAVTLNKDDMMQLINRLSLFATGELAKSRPYGKFEFNGDSVTVYDLDMRNNEQVFYETGELELNYPVSLYLDLADFKSTIEGFSEDSTISLSFGDGEAVVVTRGNIRNVIPEVRIS